MSVCLGEHRLRGHGWEVIVLYFWLTSSNSTNLKVNLNWCG